MLYSVGSRLPDYRVKALNNEPDSANLLHNEEYARRCGFGGCVVPGVLVYAYLSRSVVDFFGEEWLARGTVEVRIEHPVYDGEEVRIGGFVSDISGTGSVSLCCKAVNPQGMDCGTAVATLPCQPPGPGPSLNDYPPAKLTQRRTISLDTLEPGEPLIPIFSEFTRKTHWEYCQKQIKDHHPVYLHALHPGWLASRADRILEANFDLPPWMLVASSVRKYRAQCEECVVETRGRVQDRFESEGHHFVVLDVAIFTDGRCLESITHTVIFRIAPDAA
jgi:hypothetical protein